MTNTQPVAAGDFELWLQRILHSFQTGEAVDVPCGDCRGCCRAGRFVHLTPSDHSAHAAIAKPFLHAASGMPKGYAVMGYRADGACPMLDDGNCSIYPRRPATCRGFDCRVLAAAGLQVGGKWNERINARVQAWRFSFPRAESQQRLDAIRRAAEFIERHPDAFPGGRAPREATTIAVLALKVHPVFLALNRSAAIAEIAEAIVAASRRFEANREPATALADSSA